MKSTPQGYPKVHVVGGGLAGSEAAYQLAQRGIPVLLHEMRPHQTTAAHKSDRFAELVCSNSFKSANPDSAPGLLKQELSTLGSLILRCAADHSVPADKALAVDRAAFANAVSHELESCPHLTIKREEITALPPLADSSQDIWIVATGPLTAPDLAKSIDERCGGHDRIFFYDAIAPIVDYDSIDPNAGYWRDRYGEGEGDYFNLPLSKDQYVRFIEMCRDAEKSPLHSFENTAYFESCLPIEVMIDRGVDTLRFGPMKPVGLHNPVDERRPYAVIQLRKENREGTILSMVGFQTKMKWPEQRRVFRTLPGMEDAEFLRYGSVHRNTYVDGPRVLAKDLSLRSDSRILLAGQLTGVEGYLESTALGMAAALSVFQRLRSATPPQWPSRRTMLGALIDYVTVGPQGPYQPMNCNFGLLPPAEGLPPKTNKKMRRAAQCHAARKDFSQYEMKLEGWFRDISRPSERPSQPSPQSPPI